MRKTGLVLLLFLCAGVAGAATMPEDSPYQVIKTAAEQMAAELDGRKDYLSEHPEELYDLISDILLPHFDSRYAAYLVLNKHWGPATEEQRAKFIDAFYKSLLRNYAKGLLEFDPGHITVMPPEGEVKGKRSVVHTEMRMADGSQIPVNYSLRRTSSGWKVYDVRVDGVSYIRNYRSQFDAEISALGIDAVIARLQSEAEELHSDKDQQTGSGIAP